MTVPVLKILGSRDCVASPDDAARNRGRLPASADWQVIDGASHAQFGYYGSQLGDCAAGISRQSQHHQATDLVLSWMARLRDR